MILLDRQVLQTQTRVYVQLKCQHCKTFRMRRLQEWHWRWLHCIVLIALENISSEFSTIQARAWHHQTWWTCLLNEHFKKWSIYTSIHLNIYASMHLYIHLYIHPSSSLSSLLFTANKNHLNLKPAVCTITKAM